MRTRALGTCAAGISLLCGRAYAQIDDQVMQERLAKHAGIFVHYVTPRRLENTKPNAQGVVDLSIGMLNSYAVMPTPRSGRDELAALARSSDAVVVGTTAKQYSALTAQHTFVYSDWAITVTKVFKNTSPILAQEGTVITVARPGGELVVQGQRVVAHDSSFPEFVMGHEYVFFLSALPESSSFRAWEGSAFDITGPTPSIITDPRDPTPLRAFSASLSSADFLIAVERSLRQ
jgi:hypothetical protein